MSIWTHAARAASVSVIALALASCGGDGSTGSATGGVSPTPPAAPTPPSPPRDITGVSIAAVATFKTPWSVAFLPDATMLVTERPVANGTVVEPVDPGALNYVTAAGIVTALTGLPTNVGILDAAPAPDYAISQKIYFTLVERDPAAPRVGRGVSDTRIAPAGLALAVARLRIDSPGPRLTEVQVIWRQAPKIVSLPGSGEPGGRIAFSPDRSFIFVTAGDRQEFDPVQDTSNTLGKIIRLNLDGTAPSSNPFFGRTGYAPEIWTIGHRNPYGLAFDLNGRLWSNENGPTGGDEFNLIEASLNYGWPKVSYGDPYPRPAAGDGFAPSAVTWTPAIAPAGLLFYSGTLFAAWRGDAIIPGLQSRGLVRVRVNGTTASEAQRVDLNVRTRAIAEAPDGAIWVLEDQPSGRLLRLLPIFG